MDSLNIAANDIIGVAVDHDATKIWYSKNGQWYTANNSSESTITIADVVAGNNGRTYSGIFQPNELNDKMNVHPYVASSSGTGSFHMNFGNNPTFNGLVSKQERRQMVIVKVYSSIQFQLDSGRFVRKI